MRPTVAGEAGGRPVKVCVGKRVLEIKGTFVTNMLKM